MESEYIKAGEQPNVLLDLKNHAGFISLIYLLMLLGFVTAWLTTIVAIIMSYVKADSVRDSWLESHIRWQLRTFWFGLLWSIIGYITIPLLLLGYVVLFVNGVWLLYRIIKGWVYLYDRKSVFPAN